MAAEAKASPLSKRQANKLTKAKVQEAARAKKAEVKRLKKLEKEQQRRARASGRNGKPGATNDDEPDKQPVSRRSGLNLARPPTTRETEEDGAGAAADEEECSGLGIDSGKCAQIKCR